MRGDEPKKFLRVREAEGFLEFKCKRFSSDQFLHSPDDFHLGEPLGTQRKKSSLSSVFLGNPLRGRRIAHILKGII